MIRIIFTCYHRYLNKSFIGINLVINNYKSFWTSSLSYIPNGSLKRDHWIINKEMKAREDSIVNIYHFNNLNIKDTLSASLSYDGRQLSSKSSSYSIEAVVLKKDTMTTLIDVQLTQIIPDKGETVWYDDDTERKIGDILTIESVRWEKKGESRLRYYFP